MTLAIHTCVLCALLFLVLGLSVLAIEYYRRAFML